MKYQITCTVTSSPAPALVFADGFDVARRLALRFVRRGIELYTNDPTTGAIAATFYPPASILRIDIAPAPE
jgi:hypothetical protein